MIGVEETFYIALLQEVVFLGCVPLRRRLAIWTP